MKLPNHQQQQEKGTVMSFPDFLFRNNAGMDDEQQLKGKKAGKRWYKKNGSTCPKKPSSVPNKSSSVTKQTSDIYSIIESIINDLPPAEEEHTNETALAETDEEDSSSILSEISALMVFDDEDSCSTAAVHITEQQKPSTIQESRSNEHPEVETRPETPDDDLETRFPECWQRVEL